MNAIIDFRAFRELRDGFHKAAEAADARGDGACAEGNRGAARGLLDQVPPPRILPRDMDELLSERKRAHALAMAGCYRTRVPFAKVCVQGDYARRLDALAMLRGRE